MYSVNGRFLFSFFLEVVNGKRVKKWDQKQMVFWRNIYGRKIQDLKIELFSGSKFELITWLVFEIWVRQIIISRNTEKKNAEPKY